MIVEDWVARYILPEVPDHFYVELGAAHRTHLTALAAWDHISIDRTIWPGVEQHVVTAENINGILGDRVPDPFGVLLIDIDGNNSINSSDVTILVTYWLNNDFFGSVVCPGPGYPPPY